MKKTYSIFSLFLITFGFLNVNINKEKNNNELTSKFDFKRTYISNGGFFSSFIIENTSNGTSTLYTWGDNQFGQLGDGTYENKKKPAPIDIDGDGIKGNEVIIDFSMGSNNSSAILDNGDGTTTLYMWGSNEYGQIGDGTHENKNKPTKIDVNGDGIKGNEKLKNTESSSNFSSVLLDEGDGGSTFYSWGLNNFGQSNFDVDEDEILVPTKADVDGKPGPDKILEISSGRYHSSALFDNDNGTETTTLYMWGSNWDGQLGVGSSNLFIQKPTAIDIDDNGTPGDEKVKDFDLGLSSSGAVLEFDSSEGDALGDALYMWGNNDYYQLGNGYSNAPVYEPKLIDIDGNGDFYNQKISIINLSNRNSCAVIENADGITNSLYTWGNNQFGQIGDGNNINLYRPEKIDADNNGTKGDEQIKSVDFGAYHISILLENEQIYAWGDNRSGQLGNDTNTNSNKPILVDLGYFFSFNIFEKNQKSFTFGIDSNVTINESDKDNITLVDKEGIEFHPEYDGTSKYVVNNLTPGKNYFFEKIIIAGMEYNIHNFLNVLTDYEINGISEWSSTSTTLDILFDITSTNFGAFSEEERTIKINYEYTPFTKEYRVVESVDNVVVEKNGKINFNNLSPGSTYEIKGVEYNKKSSGGYKYSVSISDNNLITTAIEGLFLINDSFDIENVGTTSMSFSIKVSDSGKDFGNYDYVYLFFENNKGGDSPVLAYKVNQNQSGTGSYQFKVKNLSSDTKYEFIGISIDRIMSTNDQGSEETFSEKHIVITKPNFKTAYLYLVIIFLLIILLVLVILFFVYKSARVYKQMQESIDSWNV